MRIREVLADRPVELTFFILALETAMRMRECYMLDLTQINLDQRTIYLDRSKNGDRRQVPLSSTAIRALADHMTNDRAAIKERSGRLFPYWSGAREEKELDVVTRDLSRVFALVFEAAGAPTLHFHDLRHEATCRLYEKTRLTDVLIARITGHRDLRQLKRYASLRGSDLAPSGAGLQGPARRGDGVARRRSAGNCAGIGAHVARVSGPIDCPGNAERRPGTGGWRQRSRRVLAGAAGKGAGLQRRAAVLACRAIVRAADAPPVEPPAGMGALRRRAHRRGEAVGFAGRCPARSLMQEAIYLIFSFAARCRHWRRHYEGYACQSPDLAANAIQSMIGLVIHQAPTWGRTAHLSHPQARASEAHASSINNSSNNIIHIISLIPIITTA